MRWIKKNPRFHDEEILTGFLWLPKNIKGILRWFETATWRREYLYACHVHDYRGVSYPTGVWVDTEWLDVDSDGNLLV